MPIVDIRIADRLWDEAREDRKLEWRALREAFLHKQSTAIAHDVRLLIGVHEEATTIELVPVLVSEAARGADAGGADGVGDDACNRDDTGGGDGDAAVVIRIPKEALQELITEYIDTVRQMSSGGEGHGETRLEALDMAKKVVHDRAARRLLRELRSHGFDHDTCRLLFSLLVALRVDTSRLTGVHGHRPYR